MGNKIAIMIDSCTDVPKEYIEKYNMFVLPMQINYKDNTYKDGIDIDNEQVYNNLKNEIPTTSLPCLDTINKTFQDIRNLGYTDVIVITISSKLSGTNNAIDMISKNFDDLNIFILDTKNIGIGAGFSAISAGELIEKKYSFNTIKEKLIANISKTKVFFCLNTLEYLIKGGRIGHVAGAIGTLLDIKPIISCDEEGVYYNVHKCMGRKQSIMKVEQFASAFAKEVGKYNIALAHGNALEELNKIEQVLGKHFDNIKSIFKGTISPALVVHTGPGLIGIGIQKVIE